MKNQLHPLAAGLTIGLAWAVVLFLWTLCATQSNYGREILDVLSSIYLGYEISVKGAFIGLVWAFLDGFISTYLMVVVYNFFVKKLK